jgi:hypothetical protein
MDGFCLIGAESPKGKKTIKKEDGCVIKYATRCGFA